MDPAAEIAAVEPHKARRLYLLLRDRLVAGEWPAGTRIPGEFALAAEHAVARVTVRRALDLLVGEGLIERRPGAGTFVRADGLAQPIVADLSNVLGHLAEMGRRTDVRLLAFAYVTPPAAVAEGLGLSVGERTQRSVRVRLIDGQAFSHLTAHVPERVGATYSDADLATQPLLSLLERSGVVVARATQRIGAALAGPEIAEALGLEIGSPLLSVTRVVYDAEGRGVEHLHALYRPDRYSFQMDMVRIESRGGRRWNPVAVDPTALGVSTTPITVNENARRRPKNERRGPRQRRATS